MWEADSRVSRCERRETNGAQKRDFSRFESARSDIFGSKTLFSVNYFMAHTSIEEPLTCETEKSANLRVGNINLSS